MGLIFLLYSSDQPKKHNILEDLPTNIYTKFDSNSTIGFRKEDVKQTTPFWHNGPLISLVYFQSTKKKISSNIHFYQVWFQLGLWLQKRRLKTYNTLLGTLGLLFLLCTSSEHSNLVWFQLVMLSWKLLNTDILSSNGQQTSNFK